MKASHTEDMIVNNTLRALTGMKNQLYSSDTGVRRIVRFYKWFTFGNAPLIVLNVMERKVTHYFKHIFLIVD